MSELTGTTFAGLEVRDAIGRDLVSTVYEAFESDDERVVALRVVAQDLCAGQGEDRELYGRFLRRAAAALTFDHPNALTVEEVGDHWGRGYLITPHVDTVPFDDYIAEHGPLEFGPALALFGQVADVLDAGRRAGLTHGALNPTTLRIARRLDGTPTVCLTGFGIGALLELRLRRDRKHLRDVDELLYVAPEQLRRQPVTGRTDQYAMACALKHALTGEPPFVRDSVGGLFGAHLFVIPAFADGSDAEAAILKALAKEPRERYATCTQLLSDVSRAGQSVANRRRSDRRRQRTVGHTWLRDGADAALDATSAPASTFTDEPGSPTLVDDHAWDDDARPAPGSHDVAPAPGPDDVAPTPGPDDVAPAPDSDDVDVDRAFDDAEPGFHGADGEAGSNDVEVDTTEGDAADTVVHGDAAAEDVAAAVDDERYTASGSPTRADSALSNGERSAPAWARTRSASVEDSWTAARQTAQMAYPAAWDEPEPAPATETAEDLDDVPLLSEVLSQRHQPESAARRLPVALLVLVIVAGIATAIALWFIAS